MHRFARFLLVAAVGGASAIAAQPPSVPTFDETVVVTATLEAEAPAELPATASAISASESRARQASELVELLATVAGLSTTQLGSPGKGASLFTRGTNSNHTLVLEDGARLNDPFLGGFDWAFLAPEGLERVEVVRGPYSALYGSAAVGGVIQLISRRRPGFDLALEGGADDYGRAAFAGGRARGESFFSARGFLRTGQGRLANDDYDGAALALGADGSFAGRWRWGLRLRGQESELGLPYDFFGQPSPARRQEASTRTASAPLGWQGDASSLDLHLAALREELALADPNDPFAASESVARSRQARAVLRHAFGGRWSVAAGGEWERAEARTASAFGAGLGGERQRTGAGFVQADWRGERWRLAAGVRRDEHSAFGGKTSLRGGVVGEVGRLTLRASYGEAFRAPSLGDLFFPGFGNPDLDPERSESVELGVEAPLGSTRLRLTGFSTRLADLIVFDFATFRPENIGSARSRGLEAEWSARGETLSARLAATYLDATDRATGERLLRRPRRSAAAVVAAARGDWSGSVVARYVGPRRDVGAVELPSYQTVDLALRYRAARALEPYARLENAFAADYQEAAGFPAPGRRWVVGLSFDVAP